MSLTFNPKPIGVLIIDDSALMRKVLQDILNQDPGIKVLGTAVNGREGVEKILNLRPQVVTMDVQMPVMDGLQALEQIMRHYPTPVIILSSVTGEGAEATLRAYDLGAFDVLAKPSYKPGSDFGDFAKDLIERVKGASIANPFLLSKRVNDRHERRDRMAPPHFTAGNAPDTSGKSNKQGQVAPSTLGGISGKGRPANKPFTPMSGPWPRYPVDIVGIGLSIGGPPALQAVLPQFPREFPVPVVVAQHMPSGFTGPLAERLNNTSAITVCEASHGTTLVAGTVYIAPAGKQTIVEKRFGHLTFKIIEEAPINTRYRPSVDVTFLSLAREVGRGTLSVVMTGMGNDGLLGIREVKAQGGFAIAEAEETCAVYGMPRAVVEANLADRIAPLGIMAETIIECVQRRDK